MGIGGITGTDLATRAVTKGPKKGRAKILLGTIGAIQTTTGVRTTTGVQTTTGGTTGAVTIKARERAKTITGTECLHQRMLESGKMPVHDIFVLFGKAPEISWASLIHAPHKAGIFNFVFILIFSN